MRTTIAFCLGLVLAACGGAGSIGGDDDDTGGADAPPGSPDAPGVAGFTELLAGDWALPPGAEGYYCVARTLTEDLLITAFQTMSPLGTHHTALSMGPPVGPDGAGPCGAADNFATIVFGAGVGTPVLEMPDGVAVRVPAGQQLLLNLHLFNAGDAQLSGRSGISIKTTPSAPQIAGIVNTGRTAGLVVPPGASTQVGTCDVPTSARAFSVFPHMHKLGVHMRATVQGGAGTRTLIDMPYDFENQRYWDVAPVIQLTPGDQIRVECGYQNTTGQTVEFGQSTLQEMCGLGVYVTPPWAEPNCGF